MILLDTNVVSEPLRHAPELRVIEWIDAQAMETLFLPAITVAELRAGVALLPAGKRRAGLQENLEKRVLPLFAGRVLPFDLSAARFLAAYRVPEHAPFDDALIAAVAESAEMTIATRNTKHFEPLGVPCLNPWETTASRD